MTTHTRHTTHDSPVGPLLLAADDDGLRLIEFCQSRHRIERDEDWREGDDAVLRETWVNGRCVVEQGRHVRSGAIAARFHEAMAQLLAD